MTPTPHPETRLLKRQIEALKAAGSNPCEYFGMSVDGLAGRNDNSFSKAAGSLFLGFSIRSTINIDGNAALKSASVFTNGFSIPLMWKGNDEDGVLKPDGSLPDLKDSGKRFAPNQGIQMGIMGR